LSSFFIEMLGFFVAMNQPCRHLLGAQSIILGIPYLEQQNLVIEWAAKTLTPRSALHLTPLSPDSPASSPLNDPSIPVPISSSKPPHRDPRGIRSAIPV